MKYPVRASAGLWRNLPRIVGFHGIVGFLMSEGIPVMGIRFSLNVCHGSVLKRVREQI